MSLIACLCAKVFNAYNYTMLLSAGPSAPATPVILSGTARTTQATITWIATVIAYTPESYYIVYGLSNDSLNLRSMAVEGTANLTATNWAYSATITGLHPFTHYYYLIEARNSFTITQSDVQMIQTTEAGNYYRECVVCI